MKALLAGRKTQTRRVLKLPTKTSGKDAHRIYEHPKMGGWEPTTSGGGGCFTIARDGSHVPAPEQVAIWHRTCGICIETPYQVGDRLWVRETWQLHSRAKDLCTIVYAASSDGSWTEAHEQFADHLAAGRAPRPYQEGWRSSIHMPRWASRLTLVVTDVRVQRLQDISEEDAIAEGVCRIGHQFPGSTAFDAGPNFWTISLPGAIEFAANSPTAVGAFRMLWEFLYGADAWTANPFVAAISFETHHANIDALPGVPDIPARIMDGCAS